MLALLYYENEKPLQSCDFMELFALYRDRIESMISRLQALRQGGYDNQDYPYPRIYQRSDLSWYKLPSRDPAHWQRSDPPLIVRATWLVQLTQCSLLIPQGRELIIQTVCAS